MSIGLQQHPGCVAPLAGDQEPEVGPAERAITAVIVGAPFAAVVFGLVWFWGRGVHLRERPARGRTVLHHRPWHHDRLPSDACSSVLRRLPAGEARLACLGLDGLPRRSHRLGGRSPPPPRLLRPGGRSPFTPPLRARCRSPAPGVVALPRGLALHGSSHFVACHAADLLVDRDVVRINALFPCGASPRWRCRSGSDGSSGVASGPR